MDVESSNVQRVTKSSSDELLRKFAELESDPVHKPASPFKLQLVRGTVRRKRPSKRGVTSATSASASTRELRRGVEGSSAWKKMQLAERKSLLPTSTRRASAVLRPGVRARETYALGFMLEALEKTWRKTIEGASRFLVERHCSSHVQLISDVV